VALLLAGAASAVLAGCSGGAVRVAVPAGPDPAAAAACERLHRALPATLDGLAARPTDPSSDLVAAWGDDPVVLRCGVPTPAALQPTSELITVNGVDWLPEQLTKGYRFTTTGRVANVEVTVPQAYHPEVNALVDLAAPIRSTNPPSANPA
jgi:hypothetical protein